MINSVFRTCYNCLFFKALSDVSKSIDFWEILKVSLLSIATGYLVTALINHKILNKIAKFLRVSKKFGDLDVWSFIMNSKNIEWVIIRDIEVNLMYEGWVELFSDSTEEDELLLRDVRVFENSSGRELYQTPGLYLPRKREKITIEFPEMEYTNFIERITHKEQQTE
jgi:hypothetical protein